MGLKDMFDNAVKKPVTKAYKCTDYLGRAAVSMAVDGAVQVPTVNEEESVLALGCAAVSKIDESVGNDGVKQKLKKYLPDSESREKIVQALTHPVTQEALKLVVPGGAEAVNYLVGTVLLGMNQNENENDIDEQNKYELVIQQPKVMQAEIEKMQKQINKLLLMTSNNPSSSSSSTVSEQKPEDQVIT